jgi:hypothetical protein
MEVIELGDGQLTFLYQKAFIIIYFLYVDGFVIPTPPQPQRSANTRVHIQETNEKSAGVDQKNIDNYLRDIDEVSTC